MKRLLATSYWLLVLSAWSFAQGTATNFTVQNSQGIGLSGVSIAVCTANPGLTTPPCTSTLATIATTVTLGVSCTNSGSPIAQISGAGCTNPGTDNGNGNVGIFASSGTYWVQIYGGPISTPYVMTITPGGSSSSVTSVFGRSGVVVATSGDYSFSLISGTAAVGQGGTGLTSSGAVKNFLRSNGSVWASAAIAAADLPASLTSNTSGNAANVTGVVATVNGGTSLNSSGALANYLRSSGANWTSSALLAADVTGTLGVTQGGTGIGSATLNGIPYGAGTGALNVTAAGGAGTLCFQEVNGGAPIFGSCAGSASTAWSALGPPIQALTLALSNFGTTFNATSSASTTPWQFNITGSASPAQSLMFYSDATTDTTSGLGLAQFQTSNAKHTAVIARSSNAAPTNAVLTGDFPAAAGDSAFNVFPAAITFDGSPLATSLTCGTTNKLQKISGSNTYADLTTGNTAGLLVGICVARGDGSTALAFAGLAPCVFDGATTAGDWVIVSTTAAADCHDSGASSPPATTLSAVGHILSTNGGGGTYNVLLQIAR